MTDAGSAQMKIAGMTGRAVVVVLAFSFVATLIIGKGVDLVIGLRVDEAAEEEGLDISQHAETAYSS